MASSTGAPGRARSRRDWANLDAGALGLVAERALGNDVVDLVRLRAVCKAWRACSVHLRSQGVLDRRFHPRHWIMLPKAQNDAHGRRRFLNVLTGESIRQGLPHPDLLGDHAVVAPTAEGLVLQLGTGAGQLLNPVTGQAAGLPTATSLYVGVVFPDLEVCGVGLADDDTVVLHFCSFYLAIAKPGDDRWTHVHSHDRIMSISPFAGRVYCATAKHISMVETETTTAEADHQPPQLVAAADHGLSTAGYPSLYEFEHQLYIGESRIFLVENTDGELMIICHRGFRPTPQQIQGECNVSVYRVNWDAKKTVSQLGGLDGKSALFLGKNTRPLLVAATRVYPSINADTAYVCWSEPNKDNDDATASAYSIDLLGGEGAEARFHKDDDAYYLSCYISHSYGEHV